VSSSIMFPVQHTICNVPPHFLRIFSTMSSPGSTVTFVKTRVCQTWAADFPAHIAR